MSSRVNRHADAAGFSGRGTGQWQCLVSALHRPCVQPCGLVSDHALPVRGLCHRQRTAGVQWRRRSCCRHEGCDHCAGRHRRPSRRFVQHDPRFGLALGDTHFDRQHHRRCDLCGPRCGQLWTTLDRGKAKRYATAFWSDGVPSSARGMVKRTRGDHAPDCQLTRARRTLRLTYRISWAK